MSGEKTQYVRTMDIEEKSVLQFLYNFPLLNQNKLIDMHNKEWKSSKCDCVVIIDRTSPYGNPIIVASESERYSSVSQFITYLFKSPKTLLKCQNLVDKDLACWCYPKLCHGLILHYLSTIFKEFAGKPISQYQIVKKVVTTLQQRLVDKKEISNQEIVLIRFILANNN